MKKRNTGIILIVAYLFCFDVKSMDQGISSPSSSSVSSSLNELSQEQYKAINTQKWIQFEKNVADESFFSFKYSSVNLNEWRPKNILHVRNKIILNMLENRRNKNENKVSALKNMQNNYTNRRLFQFYPREKNPSIIIGKKINEDVFLYYTFYHINLEHHFDTVRMHVDLFVNRNTEQHRQKEHVSSAVFCNYDEDEVFNTVELVWLETNKNHLHKGYAFTLIKHILPYFKQVKFDHIFLKCEPYLKSFYKKFNFVVTTTHGSDEPYTTEMILDL